MMLRRSPDKTAAIEAFGEFYDTYFEMFRQQFFDEAEQLSSHLVYARVATQLRAGVHELTSEDIQNKPRWIILYRQKNLYPVLLKYFIGNSYCRGYLMSKEEMFRRIMYETFDS